MIRMVLPLLMLLTACDKPIPPVRTAAAAPAPAPVPQDNKKKKKAEETFTLKNGLRVVLKKVEDHEAIVVGIAYRAGVLDEPDGKEGLAHLVEHMVFNSATPSFEAYKAGDQFVQNGLFEEKYQDANAETLHDFTYYYSIQPPGQLDFQLQVESERMQSSKFTKEVLEKERPHLRNEITSVGNNHNAVAYMKLLAMTYGVSKYGNPKAGVAKSILTLTLDDAKSFYRTFYRPDRAVLVLYGKLPDNAAEMVRKRFSAAVNPDTDVPKPVAEPHEAKGKKDSVKIPPSAHSEIMISFKSARPDEKDKPAMFLAVHEINARIQKDPRIGGRTAQRMVFDNIRARGRSMVIFSYTLDGSSRPGPIIDATLDLLEKLAKAPPSRATLEKHVARIQRDFPEDDTFHLRWIKRNQEEYLRGLAQAVINRLSFDVVKPDLISTLIDRLKTVTPDDIKRVAAKYFQKERANVLILAPK